LEKRTEKVPKMLGSTNGRPIFVQNCHAVAFIRLAASLYSVLMPSNEGYSNKVAQRNLEINEGDEDP